MPHQPCNQLQLSILYKGCLNPVDIRIPKGSLLDPSEVAAVVGGNVLTSQRIVDVVFKVNTSCNLVWN